MTYSPAEIAQIFARFAKANPQPKGELDYQNEFTLLIAVVLSAQATDISVNKATKALFAKADSAEKMARLPLSEIENHIKSIGLWRNKAKNILKLSQILQEQHGGKLPKERDLLMQLPGVGRKTANVVANIAFDGAFLAVDTHIFRIANRLKLAVFSDVLKVEQALIKIIPPPYLKRAHLWLVLHGRYICKAKQPLCGQCLIKDLCKADINPFTRPFTTPLQPL